ncbi:MAG: S8 family peptidase [Mesorhizobium sp.]|uniref:S8 family peptidase n=1 Tax=Mesorhizobium sp. TaxID=1871066 RepID=UPI001AC07A4D|nr:S8 family peptidase [Mesorhizobium sp.]MBN9219632.1 S8 family peptidase [Mesorhizobium sp.]
MASRFTLPHIDISRLSEPADYTGEGSGRSNTVRERDAHGALLQREFDAAIAMIDAQRAVDERLPAAQGGYIEVALKRGTNPDDLERKKLNVRPGAVRDEPAERVVALYVPDQARAALAAILHDYRHGQLTEKGNPPNKALVESIEAFRRARLETLWTDDAPVPTEPHYEMWWSVWVPRDKEAELEEVVQRLGLRVAGQDRRLKFPEAAVVPVYANRAAIELMMFATGILLELRRATDSPAVYLDEAADKQAMRADELAGRIQWPGADVPSVCILDTGVNRAHVLLEPVLAADDLHAVDGDWGTDDHHDHGTAMAGMAAHGDLTAPLGDKEKRVLVHRIESVKMLPPGGADPNDPNSYGAITQAAVSLPEIRQPERKRVYCMAVTNDGVSGARPSAWSSAIDQAAAASMPGDDENSPRRLFVVSIGNTAAFMQMTDWRGHDAYPAEDPAQAWNAITVGGYTDLDQIKGKGYEDWSCFAAVGELSPYSRTSVGWAPRRGPIKPELVLEAGNRAVSPSRREVITLDSLGLLTTGREVDRFPLVPFQATSAATAEAARMAARLSATFPDHWPETIRALMIHSAEYTPPMSAAFAAEPQLRNRYQIVRRFGYGVPDFDRAAASARDQLALIAQSEIQPYRLQGRRYKECHYYRLPLPDDVLEQLGNEPVNLKITLSYFVDPNPGFSANVDPLRYQSFGLRFDLRRRGETLANFKKRVNVAEREGANGAPNHPDDNGWLLGADSMSAGSLHCDTWTGPAVNLLGRDMLCIKPVGGWWRDRAAADIVNRKTRYALVITLKAPRTDIDLYTPIAIRVAPPVRVEGTVSIPT